MLHTLTRAFLIPLFALTCFVLFWLAMSNTSAQAHLLHASTLLSNRTALVARALSADPKLDNRATDQAAVAAPITYTILPLPQHKLRGLFNAQKLIVPNLGASIFFTKTVGTEIDDCFASTLHELIVAPITSVTYCYIVVNTGSVTLTEHTLVDEKLGALTTNYPYTLTPYGTADATAYLSATDLTTQTITSNATWTAKKDSFVASASDATLVIVPTIALHSTVVANSATCSGGQKNLRVALHTPLLYCYALKNTSPITLPIQTVIDSNLGILADNLRHPLPPGGTFTITQTVAAIHSSSSVVTWTSATEAGVQVSASDIVTVQVPVSLALLARASVASDACGGTTALTVDYGSSVVFCYLIHNNGGIALQQHKISDELYGTYDTFTQTVEVDQLFAVSVTKVITANIVNSVTWVVSGSNGDVTIGEALITVAVTPTTAAEIFIYKDTNQNNLPDLVETGIAQVVITLISPSGQRFAATTNGTGIAIFAPLPEAGNYQITIDQASLPFNPIHGETLEEITIRSGKRVTKSIGYQEAINNKLYLPTITK